MYHDFKAKEQRKLDRSAMVDIQRATHLEAKRGGAADRGYNIIGYDPNAPAMGKISANRPNLAPRRSVAESWERLNSNVVPAVSQSRRAELKQQNTRGKQYNIVTGAVAW